MVYSRKFQIEKNYIELIHDVENDLLISKVSIWEIAIKFSIGKLKLNGSFQDFIQQLEDNAIDLLDYDTDDIEVMLQLPFHHQDPFDRLIIAQSIQKNIPIISDNGKFKLYPVNII